MASPTERMAAGAGFGALAKADELKKRLWFTVGALIIYRLGTYLPLPGINPGALADIFSQQSSGILGMFDMFSGGALGRPLGPRRVPTGPRGPVVLPWGPWVVRILVVHGYGTVERSVEPRRGLSCQIGVLTETRWNPDFS